MKDLERPSGLNRTVLAVIGLVLLVTGGVVLAGTFFATPTLLRPDAPLVPGDALPPAQVWYATAAGAVVLGLLAIRWLVAQADRTPRTSTWRFDTGAGRGRTELAAGTAISPLLTEVETYPGVHAARGVLAGHHGDPALALVISTTRDGEPGAIRRSLVASGLPRLRQALGVDELPTTVEFHLTGKPGPRASTHLAGQEQTPGIGHDDDRVRAFEAHPHQGRVAPWISGSSG